MGVDPGLIDTGYGIIDILGNKIRLVEAGLVRTTKGASLESRLKEIYKGIASVVEEHRLLQLLWKTSTQTIVIPGPQYLWGMREA